MGELPISAIIVDPITKKVVSACTNQTKKNPILHAEISAILKALKLTNLERLDKFDIYCSLEPCPCVPLQFLSPGSGEFIFV